MFHTFVSGASNHSSALGLYPALAVKVTCSSLCCRKLLVYFYVSKYRLSKLV